jgi:hypothetical protein
MTEHVTIAFVIAQDVHRTIVVTVIAALLRKTYGTILAGNALQDDTHTVTC